MGTLGKHTLERVTCTIVDAGEVVNSMEEQIKERSRVLTNLMNLLKLTKRKKKTVSFQSTDGFQALVVVVHRVLFATR